MESPEARGDGLTAGGAGGAAVAAVLGVLGGTAEATFWEAEAVEATASFGMGGEGVVFLFTGKRFPVNGRITAVAAVEALWLAADEAALAAWCPAALCRSLRRRAGPRCLRGGK